MSPFNLLRFSFYVAILVVIFHTFATILLLYGYFWWFDNILHFLGGLCLGFASLGIFLLLRKTNIELSLQKTLLVTLAGPLVIGLAWELFEYLNGFTANAIGSYPLDTIKDLTFDVTGGYVAYLYSRVESKNTN